MRVFFIICANMSEDNAYVKHYVPNPIFLFET